MHTSLVTCLWNKRHHLCANKHRHSRQVSASKGRDKTRIQSVSDPLPLFYELYIYFFVKGFRLKRRNKRCDGGDWAACYHFRTSLWALFKITTCGQEAARPNKELCSRMTFTENNEPRAQSLRHLTLPSVAPSAGESSMRPSPGNDNTTMNETSDS